MKKLLLILLYFPSLLLSQEVKENKWFNYKSPDFHAGIEWNLFWNYGESDISIADYFVIRDANGEYTDLEYNNFIFDNDFSIQSSLYDKFIFRYTFIRSQQNLSGPIGPDRSYTIGDRHSAAHNFEETNYTFDGSGKVIVSNILSIGYPIKIFKLFGERYLPIIPFIGLDFQKEHLMDIYVRHEGFMDWYFMDEFDWRLENKISKKRISFSFGFSIPAGIQISYMKSGEMNRIMFGAGF